MTRNFSNPGRSAVYAKNEMAATSHPLATATALDILSDGGNAVDAAIAACAVLCVVEPHMTGIGGDCFILLAEPDGKIHGLNGSGRSAAKVDLNSIPSTDNNLVSPESIHAVTAPGSVRAWETVHKSHGKLPFDRILQPAIRYATKGFAVAPRVARDWQNLTDKLSKDESTKQLYLPDNKPPVAGQIMKLPQLGETLSEIAANGADAFYTGSIAADIAKTVANHGGFLNQDDLAKVEANEMTPVSHSYRGTEVVELPPNSQGIIALLILAILERFEFAGMDPCGPERVHIVLEACRLAYSARNQFVSDSDSLNFDPTNLLQPEYVDKLSGMINSDSRISSIESSDLAPCSDTVYLTVVDRDRRAVSLINSLYQGFGVGICTENTGIMLQNRGACFTLEEGHPNCIAPSKRPLHTIIPAMAMRNGKPWLSFGVMGGAYQPCGHAHVLSNLIDYGMDIQAAIDYPRWFLDESLNTIQVEEGVAMNTIEMLRQKGHQVEVSQDPLGGGQAIVIDDDRDCLIGGSDPRKDGCALGR